MAPSCQESGVAEWLDVAVMALRSTHNSPVSLTNSLCPNRSDHQPYANCKTQPDFSDSPAITFGKHAHLTLRPRHHSSHCSCRAAGKEPGIGFARRARGFLKSQSGLSQDLAPLISKHGHDNLPTMVRATTAVVMLICSQDPIH